MWFFAWMFHALGHGINPFTTTAMNYPYGVNLADNTLMPLLGLLASPVTAIFGPIAAFNLFMRLAFFASATSMMFVLRRYTKWFPAAFLGGLLYGFSPYVVGQALGHLFLAFVPFPPLVVLLIDELVRRQEKEARKYGVILGLVMAAQFLISIEVLATTLLCCAAGVGFAIVVSRASVRRHIAHALQGAIWALATLAVIVAYPVYCYLFGPWHISGPQWTVAEIGPLRADLFGSIIPTINQFLAPAHLAAVGTTYVGNDLAENGSYLGIPLVLLLLVLLFWNRRDRFVVVLAFTGFVAFLLSLGTPLNLGGHATGIALPFAILEKIPVLENLIASRFSLFVVLASAFIYAIGLDRWKRDVWSSARVARSGILHRGGRASKVRSHVPIVGVVALVGAGVLVPLVPQMPFVSQAADVPPYFTSAAVREIPNGSAVVTYPYDLSAVNYGMLWQAIAGFSFKLVGGEATIPLATGGGAVHVDPLPPIQLQHLFRAGYWGYVRLAPKLDKHGEQLVRLFLTRWHIGTIIFYPVGVDPGLVMRYLTVALGRAPVEIGGVAVWYHADRR
ncbi:MAG TPA: hypothetical protein VED84_05890 [Acidimicrobiales bacterium]|nr:hypothetical protein [Acidimicrobiales bacterium]